MSNHKKGSKKLPTRALGDVTINDFANSAITKSRVKKSTNNVKLAVKQMQQVDNRAWDEKVDEYDGDFDFIEEENDDGTVSVVMKKKEIRRKKLSECDISQETAGSDYPIDIWFLISEFIRPEDVGTFGAICKTSMAVIYSAKFWFSLYKRFYITVPTLPERLQPECMVRLYGLRTCVIRALYFMYPPFMNRIKSVTTFEEHPQNLLRRKCILMWHQKTKHHWLYYFKLKQYTEYDRLVTGFNSRKPDLIEMLEDVSANQDDNCRILKVTCAHFVAIPPVLGLTLSTVYLPLSQGLIFNRLQLKFSSGVLSVSNSCSADTNNGSVIVFDPVLNVKVLDWWHPLYPHSETMATALNQEQAVAELARSINICLRVVSNATLNSWKVDRKRLPNKLM